ncbi:hypothetical protein [Labrys sp. ZIDIC5]|uniref:hypothetical protein n=1 Tax=Labrys sedimenti TaxID=3106036 RepID=UPI002ACAAEFF|nr:hypothetical protein [Labrys sp. ZIDIC5]MDZ5454474.1 hypothetical protein [Labrys sp. ZIDIC5]
MKSIAIVIHITGFLFVSAVAPAFSDTIRPDKSAYSYNFEENDDLLLCEITLNLANPITPQFVAVTAFAGLSKSDGSLAVGFITSAAKRAPSGELALVRISTISLRSRLFTSSKQMGHVISNDAGLMVATLEGAVAQAFFQAFTDGNFKLILTLSGSKSTAHTIIISQPPSEEIKDKFTKCLDNLNKT